MPTYQYHCNDCNNDLEVVQKFTDDALTVCPNCEGHLRKVFSAVGVVFKGSGFYATDNRSKGATSAALPASDQHDSGSGSTPADSSSSADSSSAKDTGGGSAVAAGSSAPSDSAA